VIVFKELNAREGKIPWADRLEVITKEFPATTNLDWFEVFSQDSAVLGKLLNDIMKLEQPRDGKPGKRPALGERDAVIKLNQLMNDDFSNEDFITTFKKLTKGNSLRKISQRTGINYNYVNRLIHGKVQPSIDQIEAIAQGYNKHPSYFMEYRIYYIMGMVYNKLLYVPEASVGFYQKIAGRSESK